MGNKVRISETDLVNLIEKVIKEEPMKDMNSFGFNMLGKSEEEKSTIRKLDYFERIFIPRFQEIKDVHGLEFVIKLLNNCSVSLTDNLFFKLILLDFFKTSHNGVKIFFNFNDVKSCIWQSYLLYTKSDLIFCATLFMILLSLSL